MLAVYSYTCLIEVGNEGHTAPVLLRVVLLRSRQNIKTEIGMS